jgi:integrase
LVVGKYFLFCCLTGLRISDAQEFRYEKHVIADGKYISMEAKKNRKMVLIPITGELHELLKWIKDNRCISAQKGNDHLKELADYAGIKKKLSWHIGRHTYANIMRLRGFADSDVAKQLGDTVDVANLYGQMLDEAHYTMYIQKFGNLNINI